MFWLGITALLIAAVLWLLLYPKLNIIIEYRGGKVKMIFKSLLFKFTLDDENLKNFGGNKKKNKVVEQKAETSDGKSVDGFFAKVEKFKTQYHEVKEIIDAVLDYAGSRAEVSDIFIRCSFGTGDAAQTGIAYGAIWTLISNIYAYLCRYVRIEFPQVELAPAYNEKTFEIEAEGIIKMRTAHIILAGLRVLRLYTKHKKEKGEV